jgi:hypothetical protein
MPEKKQLNEMQEKFLEALCGESGGDIRAAMRIAGYSENTRVREVVGNLKEEIIERTQMMLAMNAPRAAHGMVNVLTDPSAMGARNVVSASREILDRVGLIKKEQIEVKTDGQAMFILPPKSAAPDEEED